MLVKFDHEKKKAQLSLRAESVLPELTRKEREFPE